VFFASDILPVLLYAVQLVLFVDDGSDGANRPFQLQNSTILEEVLPPIAGKVGALPRTIEDVFAEIDLRLQVPDRADTLAVRESEEHEDIERAIAVVPVFVDA
jgi:hypothetical protein